MMELKTPSLPAIWLLDTETSKVKWRYNENPDTAPRCTLWNEK
jgi:hypothetical protein